MKTLRILIVNRQLDSRTGTEIYVRDLALSLQKRGHQPFVFSPRLGLLAEELQSTGIAVVDRLDAIDVAPDVIHGHHTWETMAAVLQFPEVAAVFVGHDSTAWHDTPPRLPQIKHYVAVDHTLRERFIVRHGIAAEQVTVVANPIRFERFQHRGPLPNKPERALLISGYSGTCERAIIEAACTARGIQLDAVGRNFGNPTSRPETLLAHYDLVFAKGRCAFEAAAVGAAVIACDTWGCGPLITSEFLDTGNGILTGRNMMSETLSVETLLERIDAYNSNSVEGVSQRIRETFDAESVVDQLLGIYQDVIAGGRRFEARATKEAVQSELLWWSDNFEKVFEQHEKSSTRLQPRKLTQFQSPTPQSTIDFTTPFRGSGWYGTERDAQGSFCWMGPDPLAWVELAVPEGDAFVVHCELAHTIDPTLLNDLQLRLAGQDVEFDLVENKGTIHIVGTISNRRSLQPGDNTLLMIQLPRTVCPSDLNPACTDNRSLGIALRDIHLEANVAAGQILRFQPDSGTARQDFGQIADAA